MTNDLMGYSKTAVKDAAICFVRQKHFYSGRNEFYMKRKHIISAKIATVLISACISVIWGMPVYADSAINASGSGEAIVTFTVPEREKPKSNNDVPEVRSDDSEDTDDSDLSDSEEQEVIINVDPSDDTLPENSADEGEAKRDGRETDPITDGPKEEQKHEARLVAPENIILEGKTKELTNGPDGGYKEPKKPADKTPYIIGAVIAGAIAVGVGATGGYNALWVLLLGVFFKKKRKHWSGLLTYTGNWAMKVKGNTEGIEDMQDILNSGVTTVELQILMKDTGVETILPANTKMSIDIEGIEKQFEADEEIFYRELMGKTGHCMVTFFNGAVKLNFVVTMELH